MSVLADDNYGIAPFFTWIDAAYFAFLASAEALKGFYDVPMYPGI